VNPKTLDKLIEDEIIPKVAGAGSVADIQTAAQRFFDEQVQSRHAILKSPASSRLTKAQTDKLHAEDKLLPEYSYEKREVSRYASLLR